MDNLAVERKTETQQPMQFKLGTEIQQTFSSNMSINYTAVVTHIPANRWALMAKIYKIIFTPTKETTYELCTNKDPVQSGYTNDPVLFLTEKVKHAHTNVINGVCVFIRASVCGCPCVTSKVSDNKNSKY